MVRVASLYIKPGVSSDEGGGDEWPELRREIIACDILLMGSPIWMGQPSSIAKRVLERMDAFLSKAYEQGRTPAYGKVAAVAVVGNEDGAHHVSAEMFQALADVGFTIPAGGPTYWVGDAMASRDYKDLAEAPEGSPMRHACCARTPCTWRDCSGKSPIPAINDLQDHKKAVAAPERARPD